MQDFKFSWQWRLEFFWVMTLCSFVGYKHFKGPFCPHLHGNLSQNYTVSQPRRTQSGYQN